MEKQGVKADEAAAREEIKAEFAKLPKEQVAFMAQQLKTRGKTVDQYIDEMAKNPEIQKLYADALDAPLSPKAHNLLHTTYQAVPPAYTF